MYDDSSNYTNACTPQLSGPNPYKLYDAAQNQAPGQTGGICDSASGSAWAAIVPLNNVSSGTHYCVDSTGYAGYAGSIDATTHACNLNP